MVALQDNLAKMAGQSPFIQVGKIRYLFTSIQSITVDDQANVEAINFHDCGLEVPRYSVADLERSVALRYLQAQQGNKT